MCLDQYYTLSNTDLFVKASDGGLKLTYTDVNNLSSGLSQSSLAYRRQDSTHSKVPTQCIVSCTGLETSVSVILTSTRFKACSYYLGLQHQY